MTEILIVLEQFEGITDLATRVVQNAVAAAMAGASRIGEDMQGSIHAVGKGIGGAVDATGTTIADVAGFLGIEF